ncbi:hypothetical protein RHMOL_Rhmol02G0288700 [Rhododendron molle]|uniref:Uncharacterized protein n=1 Tax=Rhododendron molle TaxID=49168 RepID=A0ACC0PVQ1_RHOML|nr:hypothetical protein RHMOL_Rhmol02G0288700 [Rhododendron molle]
MKLEKEQLSRIPIWAQFSSVTIEFWTEKGLSYIASAVGTPLYADSETEKWKRLSYARICVEVDVGDELLQTVDVAYANGAIATVKVRYPWKPSSCSKCWVLGHSDAQCKVKGDSGDVQSLIR